MKPLVLLAMWIPLAAQTTPAPQSAPPAQTPAAPAQTAPPPENAPPAQAAPARTAGPTQQNPPTAPAAAATPAAADAQAASPVPAAESWLTGSIDLGYRWRMQVGGSFDTYRSIVNLGSGPKLLGTEFTISNPKGRFFDRIEVRAYNWGDDPYGTFHLMARKAKRYDFNADYRDIAYFNFLPSFADPLLFRGIILDQQSFDIRRRFASFELDLLPGHWFVPYVAYDRDSGSGTGIATFVGDGNQYPVPNRLRDATDLYRGGVRFELRRFHLTLEQGGTRFKNDENLYQNDGLPNTGDVDTPVLGRNLTLADLLAAYGVTGTSIFSKGLLTINAASWLDLYGQFLYSQPESNVNYQQTAAGTFFLPSQFLFYNSQFLLLSARSKMPHTTGSAGVEVRPLSRVRILQSWLTDRFHTTGASASSQTLTAPGFSEQLTAQLTSALVNNYNRIETDVLWEVVPRLIIRGGFRRVWGDGNQATLPPAGLASADKVKLARNVAIGGVTFRPSARLSLSGEAEGASGATLYFRTGLYEYQKARGQARYQALATLSLSGDFTLLNNQNPSPGIRYDFQARQQSLSFLWSPAKAFGLEGSYSRSSLYSRIIVLTPQDLSPVPSIDRENAHIASAMVSVSIPHAGTQAAKITAGGSLFISSGSRPTSYYQPVARILVPAGSHFNGFAEWRYYGYGEAFYLFEAFRTHVITAGLRITR